jgi:hypothetical protein
MIHHVKQSEVVVYGGLKETPPNGGPAEHVVSDALAASPQQPGIPVKTNSTERP